MAFFGLGFGTTGHGLAGAVCVAAALALSGCGGGGGKTVPDGNDGKLPAMRVVDLKGSRRPGGRHDDGSEGRVE